MAIIIEGEKNSIGPIPLLTWASVIVIIVVAVYYIFFKSPEGVVGDVPSEFKNTQDLAEGIKHLNAEQTISSPGFSARSQYVVPPRAETSGRPNPFLPF